MADAGGGGSNWEPFEIIIVVILVIGLISQFTGKPLTSPATPATEVSQNDTTNPSQSDCGLIIARPHSLESVSGFVTLVGTTEGCEWASNELVALYAQIVDARGTPVSAYMTVVPTSFNDGVATFNDAISITKTPAKGTGYLILISPSSTSTTYRIPLRFK